MEVLDIGLKRPSILPPNIFTAMVFLMMEVLERLQVTEEVDLGLKRLAIIPHTVVEFIVVVHEVVMM